MEPAAEDLYTDGSGCPEVGAFAVGMAKATFLSVWVTAFIVSRETSPIFPERVVSHETPFGFRQPAIETRI
jgi:hypothetical protein